MSGINKVIIIGRLGKDPDIRKTQAGDSVASFSVATSESWKDKSGEKQEVTEWHKVVAFKKLAEIIEQYLKKGAQVYIEGKLKTRKWEKDGADHYSTEIIADKLQMLGAKEQSENQSRASNYQADAFDDDVPF